MGLALSMTVGWAQDDVQRYDKPYQNASQQQPLVSGHGYALFVGFLSEY
jgi:hypothetical protein